MCKNAMLNQNQQENNIQVQQQNAQIQNEQLQNAQIQNAPQQLERNAVAENIQQIQEQENVLQNQQINGYEIIHARSRIRGALENIPGTRDSADMTNVKEALEALGTLLERRFDLTNKNQAEKMFSILDSIEASYLDAMDKCDKYIKVKDKTFTYFNKQRYKAVKNTKEILEKEIGYIQQLKDAKEYYKSNDFCKPGLNKSFVDLIDDLRKKENLASSLELDDFVKVTRKDDEGIVLCRNGILYRKKDSSSVSDDTNTPTRENYQMARRLIELLLAKQNVALGDTRERLTRNLLYQLGVNVEEEKAAPIEASRIRELMQNTSTKSTEIELALADKNASMEKDIALEIDKLLGRSLIKNTDRKALMKQFKDLSARKLSDKDMEYLLGGGTETVRERAYGAAMRIYERRKLLAAVAPDEANAEIAPISTEELQSLLSIALSETLAANEVAKAVHSSRLQVMEEEMMLDGQEQLGDALRNSRIEELACLSGEQIREYIVRNDKFRKLAVDTRKDGMDAAAVIVDNMREIMRLQSMGMRKGLTEQEAKVLQKKAAEVDRLSEYYAQELNQINSLLAQDSALVVGLDRLYSLHAENKTLAQYAAVLSENFINLNRLAEGKRHGVNENGEPVQSQEAISEYSAARAIIDTLDATQRDIAKIFLRDLEPSQLIKRAGNTYSQNLISLYNVLKNLGADDTQELVVNKVRLTLTQQDNKFLTLHIGGKKLVLSHNAAYWAGAMESDICTNFDKYKQESGRTVLKGMLERHELGSIENRANIERFFTNYLKVNAEDMNNLSDVELRELVNNYCNGDWSVEQIKEEITKRNNIEVVHVNSKTALETLAAMENMSEAQKSNIFANKKYEVNFGDEEKPWDEKFKPVLNFLSDLFFSRKETLGDKNFTYNAQRMKKAILSNKEGFHKLRSLSEEARKAVFDQMAELPGFKSATDAIDNLVKKINEKEQIEIELENPLNLLSGLFGNHGKIKTKISKSQAEIEEDLKNGQLDEVLGTIAPQLQEAVDSVSNAMQQILTKSVESLDEETDDDWKLLEDFTVSELLENSLTGKEGEGAFNIKILKGYIKEANQADKQNMVATAFRYMPNFMDEENVKDAAGKFVSGYIKGAGPLMHKILQGLPISSMPSLMQTAVKDVRSNLATIDEDIVDAQLHRIIQESDGAIERIEKVRVLGAASVGETILVRVYGPGEKVGQEKVVKLLRPDVQNRMNRELEFMKKCAREVDKEAYRRLHKNDANVDKREPAEDYEGGMYKTYMNKIANIKKELDLRIEADNVDLGKIYEDELLHIRSMSLDKDTKKMTGAIMLEKAPGVSVDKFLSSMDSTREKIMDMSTQKNATNYDILLQLDKLRDELKLKQKYLLNMSSKWLEEALYKSGFFHGDLHSGNVMIDDDGVTIIDYGNAHKLEENEKSGIINLIAATHRYNASNVMDQIESLLKGESADIFAAKKKEFALKIKTIVQKEEDNADAVDKIFVVFNELQKEGIEIPAGIYNFVQSFIRVFGTLTDYSSLMEKIDENMVSLLEQVSEKPREENPESELSSRINKNILSRYEENYKGYNDGSSIQKCIDTAASTSLVDADLLVDFGRSPAVEIMKRFYLRDGMKSIHDVLSSQYSVLNYITGKEQCRKLVYKLRYDTSMKGSKLKLQMGGIVKLLEEFSYRVEIVNKIESYTKGIDTFKFIKNRNPNEIKQLSSEITALESDPQLETSQEKKEQLWTLKSKRENAKVQLENANNQYYIYERSLPLLTKYQPSFEGKLQELKDHINSAKYSRKTALRDLDEYLNLGKQFMLEFNENEDDKAFIKAAYEMVTHTNYANEDDGEKDFLEFGEPDTVEKLLSRKHVYIKLDKKDETAQLRDQIRYEKAFAKAGQKIYERTIPKSYKQKLSEDITDQEKFHTLGASLTSWYEGPNGEQLKLAYDTVGTALQEAQEKGQQLAADAPQVTQLVNEILSCITARAEQMDNIIKKKNTKDPNTSIKKMVKNMFRTYFFTNLGSLSYCGLPYFFQHKAKKSEKSLAEQQKKERHTSFVEPIYKSMEASKLKLNIESFLNAFDRYTTVLSNKDEDQMKRTRAACNTAANNLMQSYAKLKLRAPGKKLFASLLEEYEKAPSVHAFAKLTMKLQQYLIDQFRNTDYTDIKVDEHGKVIPSRLDQVYDLDIGKEPFTMMGYKLLKFKKDDTVVLNDRGEQKTLLERIQAGENLQWVS